MTVLIDSCDEAVLQFGIDDIYTLATLCACTLLKLTRPHVASFVASEMRENGLAIIPRLVSKLERCASDEHHTAAVYALYIRRLRRQADVWIARESSTRVESAGDAVGKSSLHDVPPMSPGDLIPSSSELWTAEFMEAGRIVQPGPSLTEAEPRRCAHGRRVRVASSRRAS